MHLPAYLHVFAAASATWDPLGLCVWCCDQIDAADISATVLSLQGLGSTQHPRNAHAAVQRELKHISRDALAAVLGVAGERGAVHAEGVRVLDVRRHDECVLYGSIPGAAHKWLGLLAGLCTAILILRSLWRTVCITPVSQQRPDAHVWDYPRSLP